MKVEILAGLLEKPANELQELLELAEGVTEIDDTVAAEHLKDHLKGVKSKGKDEGKGWGTKEALKSIQKTLKEEFEIDAPDAFEGLKSLKTKFEQTSSKETADEKLKRENEIWKQKYADLETSFNGLKEKETFKEKANVLNKHLDKIINEKFGDSSEKLKALAKKELMDSHVWDVDGNEITLFADKEKTQLLKVDGKYASLDSIAINIFKDILPAKSGKKDIPPKGEKSEENDEPKGETLGELYAEMRRTKTLEGRNAIQAKIDKISKKN